MPMTTANILGKSLGKFNNYDILDIIKFLIRNKRNAKLLRHYQLRLLCPITNFFKLPTMKLLCCSKPLISKVFKTMGILSLGLLTLFAKILSFSLVKHF